MGVPDLVPDTEARQILAGIERLEERLGKLTEAFNATGANVEWIVQNVQGIFQMFASPQMMSMLPAMMGGAMQAAQVPQDGDGHAGRAE
jgi:hypothetical protein